MLTAITRVAAQCLLIRGAPLTGLRAQPVTRVALCDLLTSQWASVSVTRAYATTTTKAKRTTETKTGRATKKNNVIASTGKKRAFKQASQKPGKKLTKKPVKKLVKKRLAKKPVNKKAKKRTKRPLSAAEKKLLKIRAWKKVSLLPGPKLLPASPWLVFCAESCKSAVSAADLVERCKQSAEAFKNLSAGDLENLSQRAKENKAANERTYKNWVNEHSAKDVATANRARRNIRKAKRSRHPLHIRDARQPKRTRTAFAYFIQSRWASGELAGKSIADACRQISSEYKALPEAAKNRYHQMSKEDSDRYARDSLEVLGHVVKRRPSPA